MQRAARQKSESGYYHVILRGIGKQILFEDDEDNERFPSTAQRCRMELGFELVAYCLMENHVHLLLHDTKDRLDLIMKKIAGSYAHYFNHKCHYLVLYSLRPAARATSLWEGGFW